MKLTNRILMCGGPRGCGMVFEFLEGTTIEAAAKTLREHREAPNHTQEAFEEQNRNRMVAGLAPMTMNEFLGVKWEPITQNPVTMNVVTSALLKQMQEDNTESLRVFKTEVEKMKKEVSS